MVERHTRASRRLRHDPRFQKAAAAVDIDSADVARHVELGLIGAGLARPVVQVARQHAFGKGQCLFFIRKITQFFCDLHPVDALLRLADMGFAAHTHPADNGTNGVGDIRILWQHAISSKQCAEPGIVQGRRCAQADDRTIERNPQSRDALLPIERPAHKLVPGERRPVEPVLTQCRFENGFGRASGKTRHNTFAERFRIRR